MNLILIGKGTIFYQLYDLIKRSKSHNIKLILWDKRNNNKIDNYYLAKIKSFEKTLAIKNINLPNNITVLKKINFDYILSINNTQIFNQNFLNNFKKKIINYHYSLIPSYKGLYSCTKVLIKQEKFTGISWHYVTKKIDDGKIVYRKKIKIHNKDNAANLIIKLNTLCLSTFSSFISNLKGKVIIKNNEQIKDFNLMINKEKYSTIDHLMKANEMLNTFKAFDYSPFKSPLPSIKINLDKNYIVKDIKLVPKQNNKKSPTKIGKNLFLIKSKDNKWLKIEIK